MTVPSGTARVNPLLTVPVWLFGNLLIGMVAIYPIGVFDTLTYYLRAAGGDDVVRPYGADGARFAVVEIVLLMALVLLTAVLFNRRQWCRLRTVRPIGTLPLLTATVVLSALPALWFFLFTDRSL